MRGMKIHVFRVRYFYGAGGAIEAAVLKGSRPRTYLNLLQRRLDPVQPDVLQVHGQLVPLDGAHPDEEVVLRGAVGVPGAQPAVDVVGAGRDLREDVVVQPGQVVQLLRNGRVMLRGLEYVVGLKWWN